jgi:di/tripeptidase
MGISAGFRIVRKNERSILAVFYKEAKVETIHAGLECGTF